MSEDPPPAGVASDGEVAADNTATPSTQLAAPGGLDPKHPAARMATDPRLVAQRGRWAKGTVTNPAGRPKSLPGFRKACREDAVKVRKEIMRRIEADSAGEIPLKEIVQAFTELSDRGGFLKGKEEADIENLKARLILTAMALKDLKEEHRAKLLEAIDGE